MQVTDQEEAALRAMLAGRFEEHQRLLGALESSAERTGYTALVSAAFAVAASERFPDGTPAAEVVEYVGDVEARGESAGRIDLPVAERLILAAIADEKTDDIDSQVSFDNQLVLLVALAGDIPLDDAGRSALLSKARKLADSRLP